MFPGAVLVGYRRQSQPSPIGRISQRPAATPHGPRPVSLCSSSLLYFLSHGLVRRSCCYRTPMASPHAPGHAGDLLESVTGRRKKVRPQRTSRGLRRLSRKDGKISAQSLETGRSSHVWLVVVVSKKCVSPGLTSPTTRLAFL